jgi:hypothetical protein
MSFDAQTLYNLMPAVYRLRDAEQGEPLKALLTVIAEQVGILEEDLAQLYDDQFIETCAPWVVPYIGDLVGDRPLHGVAAQVSTPRAAVANTIGYRRRKGTASMLEQLARDATGWNARVVEFFQLLATTQYMNHLRPANLASPDLRRWQALESLNTAFETTTHTADVRRIGQSSFGTQPSSVADLGQVSLSHRGYNIPNIGLFLWRLQPYSITRGTARAVADPADGRYWFHPVGLDAPLFNDPQTETEFTHLAEPINVPEPLRRRVLHEELETRRQASIEGKAPPTLYFNQDGYQVFQIFADNQLIQPEEILICDLSTWQRPAANRQYQPWERPPLDQSYRRKPIDPGKPVQTLPVRVVVDPVLGRLIFLSALPTQVEVNYTYGFSTDLGSGPYGREKSVLPVLTRPVTWQKGVSQTAPAGDPDLVATLTEAIAEWNSHAAGVNGAVGIIAILDSHTYRESFPTIQIPAGSQLLIVAADWVQVAGAAGLERPVGQIAPEGVRPHLWGDLSVEGTSSQLSDPGELILNGVLIEGALTVLSGNLGSLQITHCTLVPGKGSCRVEGQNSQLQLQLDHSICGPITLPDPASKLKIVSSIVDGLGGEAIAAAKTEAVINTSTILGSSIVCSLSASNSLFTGETIALRRQIGCVRFSSLPVKAQVARRYRCQPDLALAQRAKELGLSAADLFPPEQASVRLRLTPQFTSLQYGDPGYGQLSQRCDLGLLQGAEDEAEMGAFHDLYQPQRETNLRIRLDEYLRFGLEAGLFYVT